MTGASTDWDDPYDMHSISVNPSRITLPVAGLYLAGATVEFATGNTGYRIMGLELNRIADLDRNWYSISQLPVAAGGPLTVMGLTGMFRANAGEYIEVSVLHTQGASLNVTLRNFWVTRLRS